MNYYERHLGDYAKKTAHLTMIEHGAYSLLLDRYYDTEKPIPADQAHRLARARTKEDKAAVDNVLSEFFVMQDGLWHHARCDEEVLKAQAKIKAAQENGKRGGRPKSNQTLTQQKPSGLLLGSVSETQVKAHQTPDTIQKEKEKIGAVPALGVSALVELGVDQAIAADWLKIRKAKRAPLTQTAIAAVQREAEKAGISFADAVKKSVERGWQGFEAGWLGVTARSNQAAVPKTFSQQDYLADFRGQPIRGAA